MTLSWHLKSMNYNACTMDTICVTHQGEDKEGDWEIRFDDEDLHPDEEDCTEDPKEEEQRMGEANKKAKERHDRKVTEGRQLHKNKMRKTMRRG